MFFKLLKDWNGQKAGAMLSMSDNDGDLLVKGGVAEPVKDDPLTSVLAKNLESALGGFTKGLDQIINETIKRYADALTKSEKNAKKLIFGDQGDGDPKGKTFGDWAVCIAKLGSPRFADQHRAVSQRLEKVYGSEFKEWNADNVNLKAAMAESSGATGGYTVPVEFYQQLLTIMAETTFIRPRAYVQPMGSATLQIPYLDITTVQAAGTTPFYGGVKMNWTAEAQTRTETEPAFKQMELRAWELSGYSVSSNVLLQDSVMGLEKFLMTLFANAIGWYEEYAFLQGNGVGQPQGMIGTNANINVARANGNQIGFVDVATMWSKLLPVSWNNAIWVGSPSIVPQLLQLKDGASRAIFISIDSGITKNPAWSLLGRPFIPTEKVPALGTLGDLSLLDPAFYVIGDRMQPEIAASEHVNFLKNQMTWRVVERVDGQPWLDKYVTLQDGVTTVSPFVSLK
jgi:HK97 family phage major capsid protein